MATDQYIYITAVNEVTKEEIWPNVVDESTIPKFFLGMINEDSSDIYAGRASGTPKQTQSVGGDSYYTRIKIKTQKAGGMGPRGHGQALPTARLAAWTETQINLARLYTRAEYDGPVNKLANPVQVVDAVQDAANDLRDNIQYMRNAMYTGNSNDAIGLHDSTAGSADTTTLHMQLDEWWPGTGRLRQGLYIDSYNGVTGYGTGTQGINSAYISAITSATVCTSSATIASDRGDYIMFEDGNGSLIDSAVQGIGALVDGPQSSDGTTWNTGGGQANTTCQGIDGTSLAYWQSTVHDNGGTDRYLDGDLIEDMGQAIVRKCGGENLFEKGGYILFSCPELRTRFRKDESRDVSWVNKTRVVAGVKVVDQLVNGVEVPWVTDIMCGAQCLYFLHIPDFVVKGLPMETMDNPPWQRVQGYDYYRMEVKKYDQLGIRRRDTHGVIRNLTQT
ncbi:MAG: hypothetical protein WC683_05810 [bacterium]